jgi:hypothetical protein
MELNKPLLAKSGLKAIPALRELMLYLMTREWRFRFLKAYQYQSMGATWRQQVMANPLSLCHASRLCLPLPYLRCQHTFSASSMVSPRVLCLGLPSPPWAYWDPASHEKLVAWYLMI